MLLKHFYTTVMAMLCTFAAWSQENHFTLRTGPVEPQHTYSPVDLPTDAFQESIYSGSYYLILKWDQNPDQAVRDHLSRLGVRLYTYLGNHAFISAVPKEVSPAQLPVQAIIPIRSEYKLSPSLDNGEDKDVLELAIVPYPGINSRQLAWELTYPGIQFTGFDGQAILVKIPKSQLPTLATHPAVMFIDPAPIAPVPEGLPASTLHRVNMLTPAPGTGIDGNGVGIAIGDDGGVKHIDFTGRVTDFTPGLGSVHGDMTSGIAVGAGNLNPLGVGVATGAHLFLYDINTYEHLNNAIGNFLNLGIVITNTSYGEACGGAYNYSAQSIDQQINTRPEILHCFSAGNSAIEVCNNPYSGFIDAEGLHYGNITGGRKASKHGLVMGNVYPNDSIRMSSSRGPTYDGRLKPDLVGQGQDNYTTDSGDTYQLGGGTSGASPSIAGVAALLYQGYRALNNGVTPPSALIKAALLNTAEDLGRPGPDFVYGYGRAHAGNAYKLLQQRWYQTAAVSHNGQQTHTISVPAGTVRMRVMLYWNDPAGSPMAAKALVNDLDLTVLTPAGQTLYPLVLSRAIHIDSITKVAYPGIDRLNVQEQVVINQPVTGSYSVRVKGFDVPQGPQSYFLVYFFERDEITVTYPRGGEGFVPGEQELIRWDAVGANGAFTLEYSTDSMATWLPMASGIPGNRRYHIWTVPNTVTGRAFVRIKRSNLTGVSPAKFNIIKLPNFDFNSISSQQGRIHWSPVPGADRYEVYALGEKYMEIVGVTNDTFFVFNINPWEKRWMSVSAGTNAGIRGRRAVAKKYIHQPCEAQLALTLNFDNYPAETSWHIFNQYGEIAAAGGPYTAQGGNSTLIVPVCLPAGCYQFVIYDAYNDGMCCSHGNGSFTLTQSNGQIVAIGGAFTSYQAFSFCLQPQYQPVTIQSIQGSGTNCSGSANGTATVLAAGGTGNYSYLWSNGATTQTINNLFPGIYSVTVTDGTSQATGNTQVTQPSAIQAAISQVNPTCYGAANGLLVASVTGGTSPYTFQWNNGATSATLSGLTAGVYQVTITDANGCLSTRIVSLSQPALITLETNVFPSVTGYDGAIYLSVSGGSPPYSYSWSNGATTQSITSLAPGAYSITATDAHGCQAITSILVDDETTEYCTLTASSTNFEWINRVQIGNFSHQSGNNGGYGNFTSVNFTLNAGLSYPVTLTPGYTSNAFTEHWRIWIDLNRDGDFLDNGELLFASAPSNMPVSGTIGIPLSAQIGPTRMRIAMRYGLAPPTCGVYPYGEAEDYSVNIVSIDELATPVVNPGPATVIGIGKTIEAPSQWRLFPNPASGQATMQLNSNLAQKLSIAVFNSQGSKVRHVEWEATAGHNEWPLNLEGLPPGTYWIRGSGEKDTFESKLIVQ